MRVRLALLLPLVVLVLAPSSSGEEPCTDGFRWDPSKRVHNTVGQRFYTGESERTQTLKDYKSATSHDLSDDATVSSYVAAHEVLAVTDGMVSSERVVMEHWLLSDAHVTSDTVLQDRILRVEGIGRTRSYKVEGEDDPVADPRIARWIETNLSDITSRNAREFSLTFPKSLVTAGEEWTRDAVVFAAENFPGVEVDAARSFIRGKLSNVHVDSGVHFGHIEIRAEFQFLAMPDGLEFTDGGRVILSQVIDMSLEPEKMDTFEITISVAWRGAGELKRPKDTVAVKLSYDSIKRRKKWLIVSDPRDGSKDDGK